MRTVTHRTARRLALTVLGLLALGLSVGGCGGEHPVIVTGTVVRLRLDEFRITPQLVQVRAGRLKIVAYNTGQVTHNVKVELERHGGGQQVILGGTPTALPGGEVEAKLTLARGRYMLVDTLANHGDLGQFATLIVK